MNGILFDIGYGHFLVLAAVLGRIGVAGVLIRRNALIMLMSVEIIDTLTHTGAAWKR